MPSRRARSQSHRKPRAPRAEESGRCYGIEERLVMPETRFEVVDGEVLFVSPADAPHASRHSKLAALLEAHIPEDYDATVDMLTRTSEKNDFAPDASVYRKGKDELTGERHLEELAFEVVSTQTLGDSGRKAAELRRRGVRRVFAIDVERHRALEWSIETGGWQILASSGKLEDPALAVSLPLAALVDATKADDAVAAALLARKNVVLVQALSASRGEGKTEGKAEALLTVLRGRGLEATRDEERMLRGGDERTLEAWLGKAGVVRSVAELLGKGKQRRPSPRTPRRS